MLPKGNGWQRLRTLCFDAIPSSATAYYSTAVPLHEWRLAGAYRVNTCDKKAAVLETAGVEIGATLLADAEYLLDHGAEHASTMRSFIADAEWHSPAWSIVTAYYWTFFSALALTRLTGKTTLFLDKQALSQFRQLAGSTEQPAAGALALSLEPYTSATERLVTLRPTRLHLHEAVWWALHDLVTDVFSYCDGSNNAGEYRLFWCLNEARTRLGADWPSKVRNIVNYIPGRAYREVVRDTNIDAVPYMRRGHPFSVSALIASFESQIMAVKPKQPIADVVPKLCRALMLLSVTISLIVVELHRDLIARQPSDQRWLNLRRTFLRNRCPSADGQSDWPLVSAAP